MYVAASKAVPRERQRNSSWYRGNNNENCPATQSFNVTHLQRHPLANPLTQRNSSCIESGAAGATSECLWLHRKRYRGSNKGIRPATLTVPRKQQRDLPCNTAFFLHCDTSSTTPPRIPLDISNKDFLRTSKTSILCLDHLHLVIRSTQWQQRVECNPMYAAVARTHRMRLFFMPKSTAMIFFEPDP